MEAREDGRSGKCGGEEEARGVRVGTNGFARCYNISSYSWMETGCRSGE